MNKSAKLIETKSHKLFVSKEYNYHFNKKTGDLARWGKTKDENPLFSSFGPEIADIEISTICSGINGTPCKFCYKSNSHVGEVMSLNTFKQVFSKFPKVLTQIAFGIGDIDANPDMWNIFEHCRENGVIPNITINGIGLTHEYAENFAKLCGAVAVSRYSPHEDVCYNAIEKLTKAGLEQTNMHILVSEKTIKDCHIAIADSLSVHRLKELKAIIFLALKPIGRGKNIVPIQDIKEYKRLIEISLDYGIKIGFDSCSAPIFLKAMEDSPEINELTKCVEPCESFLFSIYIDVFGKAYPCSFLEKEFKPLDVLNCEDFLEDIWHNKTVQEWRKKLISTEKDINTLVPGCRQCPIYNIY